MIFDNLSACPVSGSKNWRILVPNSRLQNEALLRDEFVSTRLPGNVLSRENKHQRAFTVPNEGVVLENRDSGLLRRTGLSKTIEELFTEEHYEEAALQALFERFLIAFRRRVAPYQNEFPKGCQIAEIGSYSGGFLAVCKELGWNAYGVEIGEPQSRFIQKKGFNVYHAAAEGFDYGETCLDGVFIWNCFEQISQPDLLLKKINRALRERGTLIIRTPNALLYRLCQASFHISNRFKEKTDSNHLLVNVLAYSHLLAFPYQFGYSPRLLNELLNKCGFDVKKVRPIGLNVLPRFELAKRWRHEQFAMVTALARIGRLFSSESPYVTISPWFELIALKR